MTPEDFHPELHTFDGAVAWAANAIQAIKRVWPDLCVPGSWEENEQRETGKMALKFGFKELAELAATDFLSHRAMALGCASALLNGDELPDWAVLWLADFLEGKQTVPSAPRGVRSLKSLHHTVCILVDSLVEAGWTALRNDETEIECACDVLAAALKQSGLQPATFEGVKRLYVKWTKANYGNERALKSRQ